MAQVRLRQTTDTTQEARYVANRVRGDLLSIHEKFSMSSVEEIMDLAHDVEVGLAHDCLSRLSLFLYPPGWYSPYTAYIYNRVAPSSFEASKHSGRIERCSLLVGGTMRFEVGLRDSDTWKRLESYLKISWIPCIGQSTVGMSRDPDGGYASGELGFSRSYLRREGY